MDATSEITRAVASSVVLLGDRRWTDVAGHLYSGVKSVVDPIVARDREVRVATPAMIIRPEIRTDALLVVTDAHVVVAWSKGLFRPKVSHEIIDRSQIDSVSFGAGTTAATRSARVLTLSGDFGQCQVAVPQDAPALEELLTSALDTASA